jgi:hypothetical protein
MAEEKNKNEKEDKKINDENKIPEPSKLKTNYGWECYKDTGNC